VRLSGARCFVVGGTRRLGRVLAADLVGAGVRVVVTSRDADAAARAARELGGAPRAVGLRADTATAEGARTAVAAAARALGGLDVVVYTASGAFVPTAPHELDEAAWDRSFDAVARGFFFTACAARDLMAEAVDGPPRAAETAGGPGAVAGGDHHRRAAEVAGGGGRLATGDAPAATRGVIVAITDLLGLQAWAAFAAHGAAKAAQIHLVKTLARAWAKDGVRVCGVAPGPVDLVDDERRDAALRTASRGATGRLVTPAEVAAGVRFCLENDAVTGVNVIVDAGALVTS